MTWEDSMRRLCAVNGNRSWTDLAADRKAWAEHADEFVTWFADTRQSLPEL